MENDMQSAAGNREKAGLVFPVLLAVAVIVADQLTKWWIMRAFRPGEILPVISGFFNITYLTNTGAAFGFWAGEAGGWRQVFFVTVAVVAVVVIGFAVRHYRSQGSLFVYGLLAIGGGALGNLIDRLRWGSVVDFLDFYVGSYHWPAFNVADSAITVGVGLFLLASFLIPEEH